VGHDADRDIAVGDDADQPAVLDHWQRSDIQLAHEVRHVGDRLQWRNDLNIGGHDFTYLHLLAPYEMWRMGVGRARPALTPIPWGTVEPPKAAPQLLSDS